MKLPPLTNRETASRIPFEVKAVLAALHLTNPDGSLLRALGRSGVEQAPRVLQYGTPHPAAGATCHGQFPRLGRQPAPVQSCGQCSALRKDKTIYREAAKALNEVKIEHILIKGFTQAPNYVADPRLRVNPTSTSSARRNASRRRARRWRPSATSPTTEMRTSPTIHLL